jgi:rfaE bifunctional protein kinase chain/domain
VPGSEWGIFEGIARERLEEILSGMGGVRAVLAGDICLDAYWKADMTLSELSRETPHFAMPVVEERYSPGAGGNAAVNLAALGPERVTAVGVAGRDWRGDILLKELAGRGVDVSGVVSHQGRVTSAYIKPCRQGISALVYEDPRLDFFERAPQPAELDELLIDKIDRAARSADVLCVSDQFQLGCVTAAVREEIVALAKAGLRVVVDSRYRIGLFAGCILKPNELEGTAAAGTGGLPGMEGFAAAARGLARKTGSPVCMTVGEHGCIVAENGTAWHVPGVRVPPPLDICGAGDTFLAAFACALAAGASMREAAHVANLASSVTVKKLGQTGTASREEILRNFSWRSGKGIQ